MYLLELCTCLNCTVNILHLNTINSSIFIKYKEFIVTKKAGGGECFSKY